MARVLVTGEDGFLGAQVIETLLEHGHDVARLESGSLEETSLAASDAARRVARVPAAAAGLRAVLTRTDAVVHLPETRRCGGTGCAVSSLSGARGLLEALRVQPVERLVLVTSMAVYGEGAYACGRCGEIATGARGAAQLEQRRWEPDCRGCGRLLRPIPTRERWPEAPLTCCTAALQTLERFCVALGRGAAMRVAVLRPAALYGPGQPCAGPQAGVAARFAWRVLNGQPLEIFEDGEQRRDFLHVADAAAAVAAALERAEAGVYNIGSGKPLAINRLAAQLVELAAEVEPPRRRGGSEDAPALPSRGGFRPHDARHRYADIALARAALGFEPRVRIEQGLRAMIEWLARRAGARAPLRRAAPRPAASPQPLSPQL